MDCHELLRVGVWRQLIGGTRLQPLWQCSMLKLESGSFTKGNKRGEATRGGQVRKSRLFFEEEQSQQDLN